MKGFESGNIKLFWESRAVDEDSDLICKNVNQKSLDPSEIYHLEIEHVANYRIWNIIAFNLRSIVFLLVFYADLFQSDKGEGLLPVQI